MKIIKVVYFTENGKMSLQKLKEAAEEFIFEEKETKTGIILVLMALEELCLEVKQNRK